MTRAEWLKKFPKEKRRDFARKWSLAWILEYQPKILLPKVGFIPFEPFDYQQEFLNCRTANRLVNKARQNGMSTAVAGDVAWELGYVEGAQIVIISKGEKEAKQLHRYISDMVKTAAEVDPEYPAIICDNKMLTELEGGRSVRSLTSSKETGRSFSASHLILDEAAFQAYAEDIYQASSPSIAQTGGRITVISTPKGKGNLFAKMCNNPEEYDFTYFEFPWWLNPVYNPYLKQYMAATTQDERNKWIDKAKQNDWYKKTRKKHSDLAFKQEFECNFDALADAVFNMRQLDKVFVRNYLKEGVDNEAPDMSFYTSDKIEGHYYSSGVDFGRKRDATVIITYDISENPARMVEYKRIEPGCSWEEILLTTRKTYDKFESDMLCDATGVGDVIYESISDIADPYIISDNQFSKNKYNLIENVRRAMDNKAIKMPKIPQLYKEHEQYLWNDKLIVQDSVIANALAVKQFYDPDSSFVGADPSFNYLEGEVENG